VKAYDIYIFDLDGTITDTMTVWLDILRDALNHFKITPPDDKELAWYSHDWKQLRKIGFPEEKFDEFAKVIYGFANKRLPEADFHHGAYAMLENLKNKGKKIGIFSSMDREMFEPAMEQRNLYQITNVAIAGNDLPNRKPHPAGLRKALTDLGVSTAKLSKAVYVGDKDTDIQTAHNAGIDSILYYPISHSIVYDLPDLKKHNPTHIITDWEELVG
jgi:beta-phosphoglucomutase-like phosphatase (HAD superfamily)